MYQTGASIQPTLSFSVENLSLTAWGSTDFDGYRNGNIPSANKELDLTLAYTFPKLGLTVSVADMWWAGQGAGKYFDFNNNEPDGYDKAIDKLLDKKSEEDYRQTRDLIIKMELDRGDDGFIKLRKRHTQEEWTEIFNQDPWKYGLYVRDGKLRLIPKQSNRNAKGFIKLVKKSPAKLKSMEDFERDENGFIILKRVVTKMEQQKIKEEKRKKKKKKE